jgi:hypothetical protein
MIIYFASEWHLSQGLRDVSGSGGGGEKCIQDAAGEPRWKRTAWQEMDLYENTCPWAIDSCSASYEVLLSFVYGPKYNYVIRKEKELAHTLPQTYIVHIYAHILYGPLY